ncbi:c-type cytochrome [Hydrogenimonas sp. SS33]|uniref:c-type cytochrome n=1 Tax=Hydrogenimonas leucolamina TaxID=2954236 RepID=UPI00336C0043
MKKTVVMTVTSLLLLSGCGDHTKKPTYEGAALAEQKCSHCHNLEMPPKTSPDEKAPPMMAVVFHVRDFMKVENPSEKRQKFIDFVTDYVINPSASKSFCDKKSLQEYGVMPSQKGKVTPEELEAIAGYMYDHFDPGVYLKIMERKARMEALPAYKRVLVQKNCLGCHGVEQDKIAPSFHKIAQKYHKVGKKTMAQSIRNGSRGKWRGFKVPMPPFRDLSDEEMNAVTDWILRQ